MSSGYGRRLRSTQRLVLAAVAVGYVLAMLGVAGLVAVGVRTRRQEIGVRLALGSPPSRILFVVARETLVSVGIGIIVALGCVASIGRLIEGRVVPVVFSSLGASYINPVILVATVVVISVVALVTALSAHCARFPSAHWRLCGKRDGSIENPARSDETERDSILDTSTLVTSGRIERAPGVRGANHVTPDEGREQCAIRSAGPQ